MINKYSINLCIKYIFENVYNIKTKEDYIKLCEYITNENSDINNINEAVEKVHRDILLSKTEISIDEHMLLSEEILNNLKEFASTHYKDNRVLRLKLPLIELEFNSMCNTFRSYNIKHHKKSK
ncbi:MAG: hypothetical protein IJD92_04140 [Bacilli bacterium]|nr:hypothetical protein [Bacilli bacterium]